MNLFAWPNEQRNLRMEAGTLPVRSGCIPQDWRSWRSLTAKPQGKNAHLQRSEVVICSHGCMSICSRYAFAILSRFSFPPKKSALKHAYPHLLLALIGSQSLFFNNQPKLGISHNLIPFHPKQETPKDPGNPRTEP